MYQQALKTLQSAVAPGTRVNRSRQAKAFITFSLIYAVNFLYPTITDLVMYIKFMANSYSSPASIKNYFSGAKYWVTIHGGDISSFLALETSEMMKAVILESDHVPSPAAPLTPHHIKIICLFLDSQTNVVKAIKPCMLFTFTCLLRASNVVSPNLASWGGAHTLLTSDVIENTGSLSIIVRSTKTTSKSKPVLLKVLPSPMPLTCPVKAWLDYRLAVNPRVGGPAFVKNSGAPLTSAPVVAAMRAALRAAGVTMYHQISMHSLRRGGAQAASGAGLSQQEIMKHGIWKSPQGLSYYLKPASTEVPRALAASLAS